MQRAMAHYLPREMAVLGLLEFMLSLAVIDTVIQIAGAGVVLPAFVDMLPRCDLALAVVLTIVIGGVALTTGLYRPEVCLNRKRLLVGTSLAAIVIFTLLLTLGSRLHGSLTIGHSMFMAEVMAAWLATMALIRLVYIYAIGRAPRVRRVLLLGHPRQIGDFGGRLGCGNGRIFEPVVLPGWSGSWRMLREHDIWGVVVASEPDEQAMESLLDCKLRGTPVLSSGAFHENYLGRIDLAALTTNDLLLAHGFTANGLSVALKRLCDIVIGACMLVLLLPLMAIAAVAVKLDSPGPALYRQQRVGRFETPFTVFKFRSMTVDAEAGSKPCWAQKQDPRITRLGRFMRAARIDELPQLVNVIRGEMSLVGPRPERPHFVEQLVCAIPFYRQRAYVKPGLTGWAQVNFPYGASVDDAREKLAYDLYYVKNRSFFLDMRILITTIRVILLCEGAR